MTKSCGFTLKRFLCEIVVIKKNSKKLDLQAKHVDFENVSGSFFKDQMPFYLLIALSFFPVMPFGVMSAAIILFILTCIASNFQNLKHQYYQVGLIPLLMNIAFFLLLLLSLTYSENLKFGWQQIERGLPILLLPIVFLYFPPKLTKKELNIVGATFVLANLLFIVFLFFYLVNNASDFKVQEREGLVLFEGLNSKGFLMQLRDLWNGTFYEVLYYAKKNKESFLEIHKTYASQSILWSIVILAFFSLKSRFSPFKKIVQVVLLIILAVVLLYLYSMMNLLLLAVLSPVLLYAVLGPIKYRIWVTLGSLALAFGVFFMLTFGQALSSNSYEKYKQYENPMFIFSNLEKMLQKDERNAINECNASLLTESPLFGYGVGDVQDVLNSCYANLSDKTSVGLSIEEQNLNSHNYYAFLGIAGGVVTIVFFVAMIGFNASIAVRKKDLFYLAFILIIAMNLLTENTLGRANGILFFALFNSILLAKNLSSSAND